MIRTLALLLLLPLPALAQGLPPGTLIAALSGDWNGDGAGDLAVLVQGKDATADLILYHGDERRLAPVLTIPGAVFAGPMHGQTPGLQPRSDSSFVVSSEQIGIGRSPWTQEVTIAWRSGAWVVAGFTTAFYDRLDPERQGRCDVNLLSGGWEGHLSPGTGLARREGRGRDGPRAFPLAELTEEYFPQVCVDLLSD